MVAVLVMSAKLATLGLLKLKVMMSQFLSNKILSRDSNYIVDAGPKFGNSSISMREVIITTIL